MAFRRQIGPVGNLVGFLHHRVDAPLRGLRVLEAGQHRPAVLRNQDGRRIQLSVRDTPLVGMSEAHQDMPDDPQFRVGG